MSIRWILLFLIAIFSLNAECTSLSTKISKLQISTTAGLTYASQYMTDGFKVGDGGPVMQPMLHLMNSTKEFSFTYWSALQVDREKREYDEHDLFFGFNHNYLGDSKYAFNFHSFYDYWFYPNSTLQKDKFGDQISNIQKRGSKVQAGVSFYNLLPIAGSFLVPSYNYNYWMYWKDDRQDMYQGGGRHELLLDYYRNFQKRIFKLDRPYFGGSASVNYHDGAFGVKSGWSHSIATVYSGFHALGAKITASLNHQWTYQSTVNPSNEFWSTLSLSKEF